jgi:hypothetical protein
MNKPIDQRVELPGRGQTVVLDAAGPAGLRF